MFGEFTKRFVQTVSPGGSLISNPSLHESKNINCLQLVIKKKGSIFRGSKHRFLTTTLDNLLTNQQLTPELEEKDYLVTDFTDVVDNGQQAKAGVDHPAGELHASAESTQKDEAMFAKLKIQTANMDKLINSDTTMSLGRLFQKTAAEYKNDSFPRQLLNLTGTNKVKKRLVPRLKEGEVLAFVTEKIYSTAKSVKLVSIRKKGASLACLALKKLGLSAAFQENKHKSYTLDAGVVIAYSLRKIDIEDGALECDFACDFECDFVCDDFEDDGPRISNNSHDSNLDTETPHALVIREALPSVATSQDSIDTIELVQKELQKMEVLLGPLADLPQATRSALFQNFFEVLKDRDTLSELEDTLDRWCDAETCALPKDPSARAIMDLLRPTSGRADSSPLLKAAHLLIDTMLIDTMDMLPDTLQSMLAGCSPDVLRGLNTLVSGQSPPLTSLPRPLQEGGEFHWATKLLCSTNETLGELTELCAEMGGFLLALCTSVRGLCMMQD